jgi:hypothetical protein
VAVEERRPSRRAELKWFLRGNTDGVIRAANAISIMRTTRGGKSGLKKTRGVEAIRPGGERDGSEVLVGREEGRGRGHFVEERWGGGGEGWCH